MKIYRFIYLLGFFACCPFHFISAQYSLSGIVGGDTKETELLEGVEIYIPELNRSDISREGGTYIFRGIGDGVFHVIYSKSGYRTVVRTVLVKDTATVVHVKLESTGAILPQLPVGTQSPEEFPHNTIHITSGTYKNKGELDLLKALTYTPGLDVMTYGNAFSKPVIRGFSTNRIQVFQFGTRIENQTWYDKSSSAINDLGNSNVEIIKGPASLMYGEGAFGGVIVVKEEKTPVPGSIIGDVSTTFFSNTFGYDIEAGLKGFTESGFLYGLQLGTESQTSYVQGAEGETRKNTEDLAFAVNSKYKDSKVKIFVGASKPWGLSKLTYSGMSEDAGIIGVEDSIYDDPLRFNEIQRERDVNDPYIHISSNILSNENTFLLGRSKLNLNLAYQTHLNEVRDNVDDHEFKAYSMELNSITFDLKYVSDPLKKFGYSIGTQGIFQENKNAGNGSIAPDSKMNSLGAYLLLGYEYKKFNFNAGARYDTRSLEITRYKDIIDSTYSRPANFKKEYQPISGSFGIGYEAAKDFLIRLTASTGYSAPNYRQLYAYGLSFDTSRFEIGNEDLRYEQIAGLEIAFLFEGKSISLGANFFYNQLYDHIYLANTGGNRLTESDQRDSLVPVYYFAQTAASISGAEFSFTVHPKELKWLGIDLAYSMQRGSLDNGEDLMLIPPDKAIASIQIRSEKMNYLHSPYLRFTLRNYFDQDLVAEHESSSPGYSLFDMAVGGNIRWGHRFLMFSISANNILNESYSSHLSTLRFSGYRDMGRNVVIRLTMPFGILNRK